jgi:hypothetical protein
MIRNDDLHIGSKFFAIVVKQFEKLTYRDLIFVGKTVSVLARIMAGGIMRLRGLIKHEYAGHRTVTESKDPMEAQVNRGVVADPVFSASHLLKR